MMNGQLAIINLHPPRRHINSTQINSVLYPICGQCFSNVCLHQYHQESFEKTDSWAPVSGSDSLSLDLGLRMCISRGTWVAQSVKHPTSGQVMISRLVGSSPVSDSVLTAQSLDPASDSVSPSLFALCPFLTFLCMNGAPGWLSRLSIRLQLRSRSHSS